MVSFLFNLKTGVVAFVALLVSLFLPSSQTFETPPTPASDVETVNETPAVPIENTAIPSGQTTSETSSKNNEEIYVSVEPHLPSVPTSIPITPTSPPPEWDLVNERARSATVNILCTPVSGGPFSPISGSGVFIDSRGIILTNAHIGQYFLLKDYLGDNSIDCLIRQGSPARALYRARLLYISASWVTHHHTEILVQRPVGTGEFDFALLLVTERSDPSAPLPDTFPYLETRFIDDPLVVNEPVIITAYPAGFLGGATIQTNLFLTSASATIEQVYTFNETSIDAISLGGNTNAQQGSSGGAIVSSTGELAGIVVTSTEAPKTSGRDLHAITLSHINRVLKTESGYSLSELFANYPALIADSFIRDAAPSLISLFRETLTQAGY